MPLPPPTERKHLHRRTIVCHGFERADGGFEADATVTDVKSTPRTLPERGTIAPGEPIHAMSLRLILDQTMTITGIEAVMDDAPYRICPAITPNFKKLIGAKLTKGFGQTVRAALGGIEGCVHLTELLRPAATTALQTTARARRLKATNRDKDREKDPVRTARSRIVDSCHAWASDGPVVKREIPEFYTGS